MKLKYNFIISEIAGQTVAIPINTEGGEQCAIKTNKTGAFILELLKNETNLTEIIENIKQNFEIEDSTMLENWVSSFIEKLKKAEVLENEQ